MSDYISNDVKTAAALARHDGPMGDARPSGSYSTRRQCPYCEFVTLSRDEFWEHHGAHELNGDVDPVAQMDDVGAFSEEGKP